MAPAEPAPVGRRSGCFVVIAVGASMVLIAKHSANSFTNNTSTIVWQGYSKTESLAY
jgi:hypothetical protein